MNEEKEEEGFLKIGDNICLYADDSGGYLYADGPVNTLCFIYPSNKSNPNLPNVKAAVFQVTVPGKFSAQKELANLKKEPNQEELKEKISQVEKRVKAEQEGNIAEQERSKGQLVSYGQVIQLQQYFSWKYLHASSYDASQNDAQNMKVELVHQMEKQCWFRILPRFKVPKEGDTILYGEEIVLESVKMQGQFLHVGSEIENSFKQQVPEVDISVTPTSFSIVLHSDLQTYSQNYLKGGDVITLVHNEFDSNLSAEGNFCGVGTEEGVHLRKRSVASVESNSEKSPSFTCWQIEICDNSISGECLKAGQPVYLRHLTTRKYLSVSNLADKEEDGAYSLEVTQEKTDRAIFRLKPIVTKNKDRIEYNSNVVIENFETSTFIHAKNETYEMNQYKTLSQTGIDTLRWDKQKKFKVKASPKQAGYGQAFCICKIPKNYIHEFNFIASTIPIFYNYVSFYRGLRIQTQGSFSGKEIYKLTSKSTEGIVEILKHMKELMIENSSPVKRIQRLLRHFRVIELFNEMLSSPFQPPSDAFKNMPYNKTGLPIYALNHLPQLKDVCIQTYEAMSTYLRGNSTKNKLYLARYLSFFLSQVGYDIRAAGLLMQLVKDNILILDHIDTSHVDTFVSWLRSQKDPNFLDFLGVLCVCQKRTLPNNQNYVLDALLSSQQKDHLLYATKYMEEEVQIRKDKNSDWMHIEDFLKSKSCLEYFKNQLSLIRRLCMRNPKISQKVISSEFITFNECFHCVKNPNLPQVIRECYCDLILTLFVEGSPSAAPISITPLLFNWSSVDAIYKATLIDNPTISAYGGSLSIFPKLRDFIKSFLKENRVLIGDKMSIAHNLFIKSVCTLAAKLVSLGFYKNKEDQERLLESVMNMLDGTSDKPSPESQSRDKETVEWLKSGRFSKNALNKAIVAAKYEGMLIVKELMETKSISQLLHFASDFKMLNHYLAETGSTLALPVIEKNGTRVISAEISNLKMALEQPVQSSVVYSYLQYLSETTINLDPDHKFVYIIFDLSKYNYTKMNDLAMLIINKYFTQNQTLFQNGLASYLLVSNESIKIFNDITKKLINLRRLISVRLNTEDAKTLKDTLSYLSGFCTLKEDPQEPHEFNQRMLYNFGVIDNIIELLSKLKESYTHYVEVFSESFTLMSRICHRNKHIQRSVFDFIDFLLTTPCSIREMSKALTNMFDQNEELCRIVSETHIQMMVSLLAEYNYPELLTLLRTILLVDEFPLKRNQRIVIKYLKQFRYKTILLVADEENEERMKLIVRGSTKKNEMKEEEKQQLKYHFEMVRLLATCCIGENPVVKSFCQNIFDIDEIFQVLLHESVDINFKQCYSLFLVWAHIRDVNPIVLKDFQIEDSVWRFMEVIEKNINIIFQNDFNFIYQSDEGSVQLSFIYDSVIPFLSTFFEHYYKPSPILNQYVPAHLDYTRRMVECLFLVFEKIQESSYSDAKYLKPIANLLLSLSNKGLISFEQKTKRNYSAIQTNFQQKTQQPKQSVQAYLLENKAQIQINRRFHDFVQYLQISYFSDDSLPQYSKTHALPAGEEFQRHLKTFTSDNRSSELIQGLVNGLKKSLQIFNTLSEDEKLSQTKEDMKSLQLLYALIVNEEIKPNYSSTKGHIEKISKIRDVQKMIVECKAPKILLELTSSNDPGIIRMILRLESALLKNCLSQVSESFLEAFFQENELMFFKKIKDLMKEYIEDVRLTTRLAELRRKIAKKEHDLMSSNYTNRNYTTALRNYKALERVTSLKTTNPDLNQSAELMQIELEELEIFSHSHDTFRTLREEPIPIHMIFGILKDLCINKESQDYFRVQWNHHVSHNLVAETIKSILWFYKRDECSDQTLSAANALNAMMDYNPENQDLAFDLQIMDFINASIRKDANLMHLESGLKMMHVILSETSTRTRKLAPVILSKFDQTDLHPYLDLTQGSTERLTLSFFIVLTRFEDLIPNYSNPTLENLRLNFPKIYMKFQDLVPSVEVYFRGELFKCYFTVPFDTSTLTPQLMKEAIEASTPAPPRERNFRFFAHQAPRLINHMTFVEKRNKSLGKFLFKNEDVLFYISLAITLTINIIMVSTWYSPSEYQDTLPITGEWSDPVMRALGVLHLIFISLWSASGILIDPEWYKSIRSILMILFTISSIIALTATPYLYCFHLLIILLRHSTLAFLFLSVRKNVWALMGLAFLGFFFSYAFSLMAFAFFRQDFNYQDNFYCDSLFQCFLTILSIGFKFGGGIGEILPISGTTWSDTAIRLVFDLGFFFLVSFFVMQIAAFMLGDSFTTLVEKGRERERTLAESCFICGLSRTVIEEHSDFDIHVNKEHNIWNYVYYIRYINEKKKGVDQLNMIERYVIENVNSHKFDCIPLKKAMCIQGKLSQRERENEILRERESMIEKQKLREKGKSGEKGREKEKEKEKERERERERERDKEE